MDADPEIGQFLFIFQPLIIMSQPRLEYSQYIIELTLLFLAS